MKNYKVKWRWSCSYWKQVSENLRPFASKASTAEQDIVEDIVVAEIKRYMGGIVEVESDNIHVFYLKELKNLYVRKMKYHSYAVEYEHSTRFKEKIL